MDWDFDGVEYEEEVKPRGERKILELPEAVERDVLRSGRRGPRAVWIETGRRSLQTKRADPGNATGYGGGGPAPERAVAPAEVQASDSRVKLRRTV